jgi:hypothetical protein
MISYVNAQEALKKHEVKLNAFYAVFSVLQIGYEYSLSSRTALSLTAFHNFETNPAFQTQGFASYRLYFFKYGNFPWLFVESNLGYARGYNSFCTGERADHGECPGFYEEYYKSYNAFLAGFSTGMKTFLFGTNTGLEIVLGLGRLYNESQWWQFGFNFVRRF